MRTRFYSVAILLSLAAQGAIPVVAAADHGGSTPPPALIRETELPNPALMWGVRKAGLAVAAWVGGVVVDWAADRTGVTNAIETALDNLFNLDRDPAVPPSVKTELRTIRTDFLRYRDILRRNELSDAQTRRELQRLRRDFTAYVQQTNARLAQLDARISNIEREQRRQLRMITDLQGRVVRLENRLVDVEGRVTDLEGRVLKLEAQVADHEDILRPDPDRFLRHEAYLSGAILYANSPTLGGEAAIGGELAAQYNFNQYLGVFGGFAYMPLTASDVDSMPVGSALTWDNVNVHLGGVASLLEPRSPVSFQLGAGAGIASSRLMFYDAGVERTAENGEELGTSSNVYMLVKGEIGVAPPAYTFEPIATFGYVTFLDDVAYRSPELSSNVGRNLWFVSLGVRLRQYVRGGPRRDVLGGIQAPRK